MVPENEREVSQQFKKLFGENTGLDIQEEKNNKRQVIKKPLETDSTKEIKKS